MSNKLLVVVDMQNDFIDGALGTKEAKAIVEDVADYIERFDGLVLATKDTHFEDNYLETQEGKSIPVEHCIKGTEGWQFNQLIGNAINSKERFQIFEKETFGSVELGKFIERERLMEDMKLEEVEICGVCTDICVISNALLVKAFVPEVKIKVLENLCAGTNSRNHKAALKAMERCYIEVVDE